MVGELVVMSVGGDGLGDESHQSFSPRALHVLRVRRIRVGATKILT